MMMPVPRRMRLVCAARKVRAITGSKMGSSGASGDGGTCGSGSTTCSPAHKESKPAASAAWAMRNAVSGLLQACEFIEKRPKVSEPGIDYLLCSIDPNRLHDLTSWDTLPLLRSECKDG